MSNEKASLSIEEIELMNESEWNDYRVSLWDKKRKSFMGSAPAWYMASKESYLVFFKQKGFHPKKHSIEDIENMTESQWNEYRDAQWRIKGEKYQGEMPEWYCQDKNKFIEFLKKNKK